MAMEEGRKGQGPGRAGGSGGAGKTGGGMREIQTHLQDVDFPVSKNELVDQVGSKSVNVEGRSMNLREVINKVPKDRFTSRDELMTELQKVPEFKNMGGGMTR